MRLNDVTDKSIAVALEILKCSHAAGDEVGYRKLSMMTYYIQCIYYSEFCEFLIDEDFYAWDCGPTLKSIYKKFRENKSIFNSDIRSAPSIHSQHLLTSQEKTAIDMAVRVLCNYGGTKLMHEAMIQSPWNEGYLREDKLITKESIEIDLKRQEEFYG